MQRPLAFWNAKAWHRLRNWPVSTRVKWRAWMVCWANEGVFRAAKILVKCPSKYQEQSEEYQQQRATEGTP